MDPNGSKWVQMGQNRSKGCKWVRLGSNGSKWVQMGLNGFNWEKIEERKEKICPKSHKQAKNGQNILQNGNFPHTKNYKELHTFV